MSGQMWVGWLVGWLVRLKLIVTLCDRHAAESRFCDRQKVAALKEEEDKKLKAQKEAE